MLISLNEDELQEIYALFGNQRIMTPERFELEGKIREQHERYLHPMCTIDFDQAEHLDKALDALDHPEKEEAEHIIEQYSTWALMARQITMATDLWSDDREAAANYAGSALMGEEQPLPCKTRAELTKDIVDEVCGL